MATMDLHHLHPHPAGKGSSQRPPARRGSVPRPSCGHRNCHLSVPSARGAATAKSRPGRCLTRWENLGVCQGVLGPFFWFEDCGVVWRNWGEVWGVVWGVVFFFSLSFEENKWRPRFLWGPFFDCGVFPAVGKGGEFGNIRSYRYDMKVKFIADSALCMQSNALALGPLCSFSFHSKVAIRRTSWWSSVRAMKMETSKLCRWKGVKQSMLKKSWSGSTDNKSLKWKNCVTSKQFCGCKSEVTVLNFWTFNYLQCIPLGFPCAFARLMQSCPNLIPSLIFSQKEKNRSIARARASSSWKKRAC